MDSQALRMTRILSTIPVNSIDSKPTNRVQWVVDVL